MNICHSTIADKSDLSILPRNAATPDKFPASERPLRHRLGFIQKILDKYRIPPQVKEQLLKQVEVIYRQLDDRRLALAIVGESSEAKNNVLNKLLGEALLPTAQINDSQAVTTICHGQQLHTKVALKGGELIVWQHGNQKLAQILGLLNPVPQTEAEKLAESRRLLKAIKTNEEIASHLQRVEIAYDSDFLAQQVAIVDIPGLSFDRAEYAQALFQMFEQQAGIALVVIPATQGLSQNLITCLHQSLHPYRERCLFVVTGIEDVCLEEREAFLSALESRLKIILEVASPMIYVCSDVQVVACNPHESEGYQRLHRLRQSLLQQMETARLMKIEKQLNQLSEYLTRVLAACWNLEVANYVKRKTALQHELIKNIKRFTTRQLQKCDEHLQDGLDVAQALIVEAIEQLRQEALKEMQQTIFAKPSVAELKDLERDYSELANRYGRRVQKLVLEASKNLVSAAVIGEMRVQSNFIEHYQRLRTIESQIDIPVLQTNASLSLHSDDLQIVIQQHCATFHSEKMAASTFTDRIGFRRVFGESATGHALQKTQRQQLEIFKGAIGQFFDQIELHSMQMINAYQRALMEQIEADLKGYQSAYEQMCHGLTMHQAMMQKRLEFLGQLLRQDVEQMQRTKSVQCKSWDMNISNCA